MSVLRYTDASKLWVLVDEVEHVGGLGVGGLNQKGRRCEQCVEWVDEMTATGEGGG